ncbi:hypothetical protein GCM10023215_32050 [Pseudonocardia yuanmonensis]|uniref:Anti-sigma regulatory factor (Ser/Thr protein kinase) n=1 Tax=Pseudonocardia yuanmonensis TaxID=1095914 RepID=A0ABP8WPR7_9PSEU
MGAGGYVHDMALFGSDAELRAVTHRFIADGVAAGDVVIVYGPEHDVEVLRDLFDDDAGVRFEPGMDRYRHMMGTIGEYQRLCERETGSGRRVRSTGPVPFGEDPAVRAEWMRYEALLDRALGPYRFSGLCRYDTRSTSSDIMDLALATHPRVVTARGVRVNDEVRPAPQLLRELAPRDPRHPLEDLPPVLDDPDCATEASGRRALRRILHGPPDPGETVTAVSEVLGNALRHGRRPVRFRVHTDGRRWVVVVTDHGPGMADPWTGVDAPLPGNPPQVGAGLWLARQLCDQLTITRSAGGGAEVRLLFDAHR